MLEHHPPAMPKPRTAAARRQRIDAILEALETRYPRATCALRHANPWQLLAATILSAQCTDERVNQVTPGLFRKYPTIADMAAADEREVALDIRSTGFFNNKAKSLTGAARKIMTDFGGEVPREMEQLLSLPGAARKTANVVLGTAFGISSGIVVDTHVTRLSQRLEFTTESNPVKIEQDLMAVVPREKWILFSHQMILFGREICNARKPRCADCPIEGLCYSKDKVIL